MRFLLVQLGFCNCISGTKPEMLIKMSHDQDQAGGKGNIYRPHP